MADIKQLITEHIDIWTAADTEKKSGRGRASGTAGSVYGVKKLRELILELAVRGKLVPQDRSDEPASELLKRIKAEKAKLIAEGKLKKEKPLALIGEDEKPFELPNEWEWVRLQDVYDVRDGTHDTPKYTETGFPLVTSKNLYSGNLDFSDIKYISEQDHLKIKERSKVDKGDILFAMIGSIGNPVIVDTDVEFSIKNVALFKPYSDHHSNTSYLLKYLIKAAINLREEAAGAVQSFVSLGVIRNYLIPLPPLTEQHRIVAKVDELMALCDQLEQQHSNAQEAHETLVTQLLATLTQSQNAAEFNTNWQRIYAHFDVLFTTEASIDALKQTLLQLAVMGKLVPQDPFDEPASELLKRIQAEKAKLIAEGKLKKEKPLSPIGEDEKPFELPKGWEWVRLELLANLITKGSSPKWQGVNYTENTNEVLFVTSENVGSYCLLLDTPKFVESKFNEIEPRSILQKGDYLMNIVGASIGRTAVFDRDDVANINQAVCLIRVGCDELVKAFLLHFFNSETCLAYMFDKQVDNARPNLSMGNIAKFLIPVPPIKEQHRIVDKVNALMALCDHLKTRIQQANQQQQVIADALVAQAVA